MAFEPITLFDTQTVAEVAKTFGSDSFIDTESLGDFRYV